MTDDFAESTSKTPLSARNVKLLEGNAPGDPLTAHRVTVLLIDDQRIIGEAVRRMLVDQPDIVFRYLNDPTQALQTAESVQPTVILQDLVMPQIDGLDLVAQFRQHAATREIPLVVLSTKEEPVIKAEAFARGANDYIVKLPDKLELLARIRYHSRGYISQLQRNEALAKLEVRNRFIRDTFGRYLSDEVVNNLLDAPEGLNLGGEKRVVTIMMSDLRGFTAMSEVLGAEQVVSMLNNYLGTMTEIIQRHGGTIDEFIGDGILVLFGAPEQREDDAARAVCCALEMQRAMADVNAWNLANQMPTVEMGIGLNTGEVIVGNIGSQRRTKYGAVGSHVNLTGRIESYTVGGQILISEMTRRAIGAELRIDGENRIEPKGMKQPITLYEVGGIGAPYNTSLPREETPLRQLPAALAVSYAVLEDKHSAGAWLPGQFTRLSLREAELVCSEAPPAMANLRVRLDSHPDLDLHAKVMARVADATSGCVLRFTAVPEALKPVLAALAVPA